MSQSYSSSHYEHIHAVEAEHFWFVARNEMIAAVIRRFLPSSDGTTFLDIGCGTGVMLGKLARMGFRVTGLDINAEALAYAAVHTNGTLVRTPVSRYRPAQVFGAVGAFDVMEHIEDDSGFVAHCHKFLEPKGLLFLTVPAGEYLWSSLDTLSGHKRRYTKKRLDAILSRAGFRIRYMRYWNILLLPTYVLWRVIGGIQRQDTIQRYLKKPPHWINTLLLTLLRAEYGLGLGRMPFGATLVVCAQKI